jgi:hypothetical protein
MKVKPTTTRIAQLDLVDEGEVADRLGGGARHQQGAAVAVLGPQPAALQDLAQLVGLRGAHADRHARGAEQVLQRALTDQPALGDDHDAVDGLLDLGQDVAGDQHRLALPGRQVAEELPEPVDAGRVQAVGRLVQDQHPRVAEQRRRQGEALAHAHREAAHAPVGRLRDARQLQHLVGAGIRQPSGSAEDPQVVPCGPARMEAGRLQRGADRAERVGQVGIALAADGGGPPGRGDQGEQAAQGGGLAGAVGPQEAGDRARLDLEAQVVDRADLAEVLGQIRDDDAAVVGHRSLPFGRIPGAHGPSGRSCRPGGMRWCARRRALGGGSSTRAGRRWSAGPRALARFLHLLDTVL